MLSDVPSASRFLVDVFSFVVHAEFGVGVLTPEEFRWKFFLEEGFGATCCACVSFAWEIVRDSRMVNLDSQTMNKQSLIVARVKFEPESSSSHESSSSQFFFHIFFSNNIV